MRCCFQGETTSHLHIRALHVGALHVRCASAAPGLRCLPAQHRHQSPPQPACGMPARGRCVGTYLSSLRGCTALSRVFSWPTKREGCCCPLLTPRPLQQHQAPWFQAPHQRIMGATSSHQSAPFSELVAADSVSLTFGRSVPPGIGLGRRAIAAVCRYLDPVPAAAPAPAENHCLRSRHAASSASFRLSTFRSQVASLWPRFLPAEMSSLCY